MFILLVDLGISKCKQSEKRQYDSPNSDSTTCNRFFTLATAQINFDGNVCSYYHLGSVEQHSNTARKGKNEKRGPRHTVNVDKLHSLFDRYASKIVKNDILAKPSESRIYEKIASQFDKYKAQSAYQAAKRYFEKRVPTLKRKKKDRG